MIYKNPKIQLFSERHLAPKKKKTKKKKKKKKTKSHVHFLFRRGCNDAVMTMGEEKKEEKTKRTAQKNNNISSFSQKK